MFPRQEGKARTAIRTVNQRYTKYILLYIDFQLFMNFPRKIKPITPEHKKTGVNKKTPVSSAYHLNSYSDEEV